MVEKNVSSKRESAGILIHANNLLIRKNNTSGSNTDGLRVRSGTGNEITKNVANDNMRYGILVEPAGNIDGGGNRASGNGNPASYGDLPHTSRDRDAVLGQPFERKRLTGARAATSRVVANRSAPVVANRRASALPA